MIGRKPRHGHTRRQQHGRETAEYSAWAAMKQRCENHKWRQFHLYGGRGISVCDRWRTFDNFLTDMGLRPSQQHSLDRINNEGNYEPSNCRWATRHEQASNKRKKHIGPPMENRSFFSRHVPRGVRIQAKDKRKKEIER